MGRRNDPRWAAVEKYSAGFRPKTGSISIAVKKANEEIRREAWLRQLQQARRMETGKIEVES